MPQPSIFQPEERVMVLLVSASGGTPELLEGTVLNDDPAGVLVEPADQGSGVQIYLPYERIETILLLGKRSSEDRRRAEFRGQVQKQKVLDQLDRIFFEMADKKGRYTRRPTSSGDAVDRPG